MNSHTTNCSCCSCSKSRNKKSNTRNNFNRNQDHPSIPTSKKIHTVSGYDVQRLIYKIKRVQSYLPSIQSIPILDYSNNDYNNSVLNDKPPKHIGQIESIVSHMQRNGLLPTTTPPCHDIQDDDDDDYTTMMDEHYFYVEFGCGTAKLSDHVSSTIMQQEPPKNKHVSSNNTCIHHILIDQQPMKAVERYCDGRIRSRYQQQQQLHNGSDVVQRFTRPISQVPLYDIIKNSATTAKVPTLSKTNHKVVAMAKHLCGSATDDAIQCIQAFCHHSTTATATITNDNINNNRIHDDNIKYPNIISKIPLVVATCCHYACDATILLDYKFPIPTTCHSNVPVTNSSNQLSYLQYIGFDERDVEVLIIVSQWASIKVDVAAVACASVGDDVGVPVVEQNVSSTTLPLLFDIASDEINTDAMAIVAPHCKDMMFPPPLPPHPIPTTIHAETETNLRTSSKLFEEQFSRQQKLDLGQYSKLLIDLSRAYYLRHNSVSSYKKVQLVYYTALSVERQLLIAVE